MLILVDQGNISTMQLIILALVSLLQCNEVPNEPVSFTLRNESLKSIPLVIPGVMNPNLSPRSNSGVTLEVGQEIYYWRKGQGIGKKRSLLLIVDTSLDGSTIQVASLIEQRKDEVEVN